MTDLVAWLTACYDRAKQKAQAAGTDGEQSFVDASPAIEPLLFNADGEFDLHKRMLADIVRKRAILAEHPRCDCHDNCTACAACGDGSIWPCPTVRLLAEEFASEHGYDESWRP